jgi:hypothetical protein
MTHYVFQRMSWLTCSDRSVTTALADYQQNAKEFVVVDEKLSWQFDRVATANFLYPATVKL